MIRAARAYNRWLASDGDPALCPEFVDAEIRQGSLIKLLAGMLLHSFVFGFTGLFSFLRMWWLVALLTKFRITTDWLASEPRQCGFNKAFTRLGMIHLKKGRVKSAISCLEESALVYPCPHNSSFGLAKGLAMALETYPEASNSVQEYKRINREFLEHNTEQK